MDNYPFGAFNDSIAPYNETHKDYCEKCENGTSDGLTKATLTSGTIFICDECAKKLHICVSCGILFDDENGNVDGDINLCNECLECV